MASLNVFAFLREHRNAPNARTLRSDYWGKLEDAFKAFNGNVSYTADNSDLTLNTVGIFDFLTLFIPFAITRLLHWCLTHYRTNSTALALLIPASILQVASIFLRIATTCVFTLACMPLIYLVHWGVEHFTAAPVKEEAYSIKGHDCSTENGGGQTLYCLDTFLKRHHRHIDDLSVVMKTTNPGWRRFIGLNSSIKNSLVFEYVHPKEESIVPSRQYFTSSMMLVYMFPFLIPMFAPQVAGNATNSVVSYLKGDDKDSFEVDINLEDSQQQKQLSAIFQLNIANILNELDIEQQNQALPTLRV